MSIYKKSNFLGGSWVKGSEVQSGIKAKLVSETNPVKSQFKDNKGNDKTQDVAKIRFQGVDEVKNISLNRATLEGLIDAFGEDSKNWMDKTLTAITEKVVVGGKRVTAVYLVPEGFELKEDADGYMHVLNPNNSNAGRDDAGFARSQEEINPADIPF